MFPPYEWNNAAYTTQCLDMFLQQPQYDWVFEYYGGKYPRKDFMKASNIIFSNGELDPWHSGGVMEKLNDETLVLYIGDSAHHLDLRLPHVDDPNSVKMARVYETQAIAKWIDEYQGTTFYETITQE